MNRRLSNAAQDDASTEASNRAGSAATLSRRRLLQYGGGTAGMAALAFVGLPAIRAAAQDALGPAVTVNEEGTAPTAAAGELTVALQFDVINLDSIATYTLSNAHWEGAVYSALTFRDPNLVLYDGLDGRPGPMDGYGLAESWAYTDDLTLTMKLKSGITFHDGGPLNSDAVKAHFERMADPANASPQAFNYSSIASVEVVDDLNLIFRFSNVDPVMITKFAGYGAYITSPTAATQDGFGTATTSGTGPYRVVEYVKDDRLTLEAWDGFWGAEKPLIKTITYRIIPNDDTRLAEFMAGSVDIVQLNVNQAGSVGGNPDLAIVEVGSPTVFGLRLDAAQAPTDNIDVRNAIAYAIDLQTIIETIVSGYGTAVPVWQSPYSFGFDESLTPYAFDPAVAAERIAASGLPTPIKLTYDILSDDSLAKEFADAIKGMLDPVGFDTEIRIVEQATYYEDYRAGTLGNVVWFGWGGWTLDFDNTYYSMMKTGESYNPSYSNPEIDALLEEQRGTLDQARRLEIAKQINAMLYADAPDVALWQAVNLWGVNARVHKFTVPGDDRFWWDGAWVEE